MTSNPNTEERTNEFYSPSRAASAFPFAPLPSPAHCPRPIPRFLPVVRLLFRRRGGEEGGRGLFVRFLAALLEITRQRKPTRRGRESTGGSASAVCVVGGPLLCRRTSNIGSLYLLADNGGGCGAGRTSIIHPTAATAAISWQRKIRPDIGASSSYLSLVSLISSTSNTHTLPPSRPPSFLFSHFCSSRPTNSR